jgi:nitrogen fixation NifU-like protein
MADAHGYDELVMDHIRNARAYRVLEDATHRANGINPLCGDEMTVYVRISADRLDELTYQCSCCGVSMVSASMMSEYVCEQNVAQLAISVATFSAALLKHAEPLAAADDPMRHALLKTVRDLPSRTPCAALPWAILAAALAGSSETVSVQV